jgi:protein TonB
MTGSVRALLLGLALPLATGCADTMRPTAGGLELGVDAGPLRPPERLNGGEVFAYPSSAWREGIGGTTVLKLLISARGTVDSVLVLRSSGDRALDSASAANARKLRFRPAERGGDPMEVWGRLPVIYPPPASRSTP